MNRFIGAMLVVGITAASAGCFKGEEDTCEYWTETLAKSAAMDRAMKKVGQLRCSGAIPVLEQLYNEGQFQEAIIQTVREIGDRKGAVPLLKLALRSQNVANLAASIIGEWRLAETRDELVKILTSDQLAQSRSAALEALLAFEDPKSLEDTLIELAGYDPNIQGVAVNSRAIEELGKIGSAKAVPVILKMAYMRTNKSEEVYRFARIALARIGEGVREALEKVFAGDDAELRSYTRQIGVQDWETRFGQKTAQLLGDTLEPAAVPTLVRTLGEELAPPAGVSDKALEAWAQGQRTRLQFTMFALGHIGTDLGVEELTNILKDPSKDTTGQRLNAAYALAAIGVPSAVTGLVDAWRAERTEAFKRPLFQQVALAVDAAALEAIEADVTAYLGQLNEQLAKFEAAYEEVKGLVEAGPSPEELPTLKQREAYAQADRDAFKMTLDKVNTYLAVARECRDRESCWLGKLASDNQDEQMKAALYLARGTTGDRAAAVAALFEAFKAAPKGNLDVQRFTLFGLTRLGDGKLGQRLVEFAEKDLAEREDAYWRFWTDELTVYGLTLARRK